MTSQDDDAFGGTPPEHSSYAPPTYAAFSPVTLSANTPSRSARRSTILVHQKSPLLLATPPQITRALAYSHPFILPLNTFVGLVTWSSGDPWQSFLLLCAFWAVTLYGDVVVRLAGPVVIGACLIVGMYGRRYSPLSSSSWSEPAREFKDMVSRAAGRGGAAGSAAAANPQAAATDPKAKHARGNSEITNTKHQKTLDEIVETLKELTGRCNALMEPLLEMTDFLSTQRTPTSATVKPALTAMFMRLLIITPFWVALTAPPWRIVTTKRVVLVAGTLILTWHARAVRVTRTLLWRSATVRRLASVITGLHFDPPSKDKKSSAPGVNISVKLDKKESELTKAMHQPNSLTVNHRRSGSTKTAGVKFTFIIYENQRRWVGLGWTNSLFAYERPAWTDEHNNAVPPKDEFELPEVEDGSKMRWRWAEGSRWKVDGVADEQEPVDYESEDGKNGWIYYDSKWQSGRRGQDGWGRWTRRRKWYRDAELVEVDEPENQPHELDAGEHKPHSSKHEKLLNVARSQPAQPLVDPSTSENRPSTSDSSKAADDSASLQSTSSRSWGVFRPPSLRRRPTDRSSMDKTEGRRRRHSDVLSETGEDENLSGLGIEVEMELQKQGKEGGAWGIGDEARMSLE